MKAIKVLGYGISVLLIFFSCKKTEDNNTEWQYLVSYNKEKTIEPNSSSALLTSLVILYPDAAILVKDAIYAVEVYTISYKSNYKGDEIIASGLVSIPASEGTFPVISFQNGTNTKNLNAPSVNINSELMLLLQSLASNGYIILATDYIGFGESSGIVHPYYQKESNNSVTTDMLYAMKELMNVTAPSFNDEIYLMGYSQGGWATLCLHKEIEDYHPDYIIKATSCGAGAYNLITMSEYILDQEIFPGPLYLPYYVYSHNLYESISLPLNQVFNEPFASQIPDLFDGSKDNSEVNAALNDTIAVLLTEDFRSGFFTSALYEQLRIDLECNSIDAWLTDSKIHFYHGTADLNVPPQESENIYQEFVAAGIDGNITYTELDSLNHADAVLPWGIKTMLWFDSIRNTVQ